VPTSGALPGGDDVAGAGLQQEGGAMQTIAVLGTGVLGSAVARRLVELGVRVRVYNRDLRKAQALAGLQVVVCDTPARAVEGADLGLAVLSDTEALRQVVESPQGVLAAARPPCFTLIDLGTHGPAQLMPLVERWTRQGLPFVEAPVIGSVHDALHGRLNFLIGGPVASVESIRPFLELLGHRAYHLGPIGSGSTAKLALNLLVGTMAWGLSEATAMLEAAHLDVESFHDALASSGLASPLYQRLGQRYLSDDFQPRFSLAKLENDVTLINAEAQRLGLPGRQARLLAEVLAGLDAQTKTRDYSVLVTCSLLDGRAQ
jgi:3-hydroxyisobutyrate dehydrogenase